MFIKMKQIISVLFLFIVIQSLNSNLQVDELPDKYSWDDINGVTYLGPVKNQNFPYACNSGWAFSTIGMIQSRIRKRRNASSPDISLSTQVLLSCDTLDYGCLGGQPINALRYMSRNNITDQSCHSYLARGYTEGEKCTSQTKCQKCDTNGTCKSQANSKLYRVAFYGTIGTQTNILNQIFRYGPITCGIAVTNQFKIYTSGIFEDKTGTKGSNHYVLLYGWGEQNGTKYWLGRNSWGSNWGQNGNFRIVRGSNNLGVQNLCYWGSLYDTWTNDVRNQTVPGSSLTSQKPITSKITYKIPDFLTSTRSILTPSYCQSSWAFSLVQMLKDRVSLRTKGKLNVDFSVQALLNCGLGSCSAETDPFDALSYITKYGIPQQNCQSYKGQKPAKQNCTGIYNCATCSGTAFKSNCSQVKNFKRWKNKDFGTVSGEQGMMTQITNYGPIICGMDKNSTVFTNYNGGIIDQLTISPTLNHYVQIVGFGVDQKSVKYWIGRNFWGTAWGQEGFFRIKRGSNTLGIQKRCLWGNPII